MAKGVSKSFNKGCFVYSSLKIVLKEIYMGFLADSNRCNIY